MTLAKRVRDSRYSKGWGPDELASRAAISRTALYQIESGKTELPRAGTLRRIAQALEVSMESLLGQVDGAGKTLAVVGAGSHNSPVSTATRHRAVSSDWFPTEGTDLSPAVRRSKFEANDGSRFAVEHVSAYDHGSVTRDRERELSSKLHDLLSSPFGDAVARILDETHRMLPQARTATPYE
jgi:transcriptional regulator with XRE-family HTH domain